MGETLDAVATEGTVAILGAGFSGIGMAIKLQEAGIRDFVLLERAEAVGGTWRDNTYPGAACDIPSHLYSFSFELNPEWNHVYSRGPEIWAYLERVVDKHALRDRIRHGAEVVRAVFDEERVRWHLHTADGREVVARFVVAGVGSLKDPRYPELPGIADFEGPALHSSRWDHSVSLDGKRVGVIGTGASAIQVVPELAKTVERLTVFQRTPPWVVPRHDRAYTEREKGRLRRVPALMKLKRLGIYLAHEARYPLVFGHDTGVRKIVEWRVKRAIREHVKDPALVEKLTPSYRLGCKRILVSDDWYPALGQPNVDVETESIERITARGVALAGGRELELDALVYCTGFTVEKPLGEMEVRGRGGVEMNAMWGTRPRAYLGITVPRFPNLFMMLGPNTGLGHNSVVVMIEAQIGYALQAIQHVLERPDVEALELHDAALDEFVEEMDARHQGQVWSSGCASWYLATDGGNATIWPGSTLGYLSRTRHFDPALYRVVETGSPRPDAGSRGAAASG